MAQLTLIERAWRLRAGVIKMQTNANLNPSVKAMAEDSFDCAQFVLSSGGDAVDRIHALEEEVKALRIKLAETQRTPKEGS